MSTRLALSLLLAGSLAAIGGALFSQYVGGLVPCELCLMERWPYYIGIPLTLAVLAAGGRRGLVIAGAVLILLLFLASAGLAFYHVGVEQHWFQGPTACTGPGSAAHSVEALKAQLFAQQVVRCDAIQWSRFGVSLAGWNFVASLVLSALALVAWRRA